MDTISTVYNSSNILLFSEQLKVKHNSPSIRYISTLTTFLLFWSGITIFHLITLRIKALMPKFILKNKIMNSIIYFKKKTTHILQHHHWFFSANAKGLGACS